MAAKKKQPIEPYLTPPTVPQDFNAAAALNIEARHAIEYWKEQCKWAMFSDRQRLAHEKLKAWQAVSATAQAVMQSYQLRLF